MARYILDTDHVSRIFYGNPQVIAKAQQVDYSITIITVQELFNGWVGRINDPAQSKNLSALYSKLWTTTEYLKTTEILNFTTEAEDQLKILLRQYPPLRKQRLQKDLRIAAIALCLDATVATCNYRDFSQLPDLQLVDWTQHGS